MEEESKMSFFKKIKLSIFNLEEYQKLATEKTKRTIIYIAILMLIFAFFSTLSITYVFHNVIQNIGAYIEEHIEELSFKNGVLYVNSKDNPNEAIIIDEETNFNGRIIIDTADLTEEQINKYKNDIESYYNGLIILKDKIIIKTYNMISEPIYLKDLTDGIHLVNIEKNDIINFISGSSVYKLDAIFFGVIFIFLYINNFALVLLDAILYSLIGYILGGISRIKLRFSVVYNIAIYSLTLPVLLNLVYTVINTLTGYTITYFSVMYTAITCIYIFTAILMIKSDIIKKQMELSKIIEEQEKIKQEMAKKELERKEEEEKERVRKKDEKQRKEEKKKQEKKENNNGPEPQANIKEKA